MVTDLIPVRDLELARERTLRFEVTGRERRGERWLTLNECVNSLEDAIEYALNAPVSETAVWVIGRSGTGSTMYWTSKIPDLFNSTVLEEGYS